VEGLLSCCPEFLCGGFCRFACGGSATLLSSSFLCYITVLLRVLSAGGITVIYLEVCGIIAVSFGGLYLWQNCPTVHIDRDQTLEV
jgi:hypothetical protein